MQDGARPVVQKSRSLDDDEAALFPRYRLFKTARFWGAQFSDDDVRTGVEQFCAQNRCVYALYTYWNVHDPFMSPYPRQYEVRIYTRAVEASFKEKDSPHRTRFSQ